MKKHSNHCKWMISLLLTECFLLFFIFSMQAQETYGSMYVENSLVHYILPEQGRLYPVIMVPGLNLSSYIFVETPDGRKGWAQIFAENDYKVYVINDPDFDFVKGGFSVDNFYVPSEGAPPYDPNSSLPWQQDIWRRWGFGSSQGNPYADARFPANFFSVFKENYPYVSSTGRSYSDSIVELLDMAGPAILLAHSAGGPQAVSAALRRPNLVKGFIMVEPTGPPDANDFPELAGMSMIGVYADYVDSRNQGSRKTATEQAAALFTQHGGTGEVISLPEDLAVFGNSHLIMQDNNSEFIAGLILNWMADNTNWNRKRRGRRPR